MPWPTDEAAFRKLVQLGAELRQYHLMEHKNLEGLADMIDFPVVGDAMVTSKMTANSPGYVPSETMEGEGRVYINDTQYFEPVPLVAWEFYIGGYQPAQKWLKDRVGRTLSFEDIAHYQRIIVALLETERLMREVDGVGVFSK